MAETTTRALKRQVRFKSRDMGQVGWTRWFDLTGDPDIDALAQAVGHLKIDRVEVVEEMTKDEFETQFLTTLT